MVCSCMIVIWGGFVGFGVLWGCLGMVWGDLEWSEVIWGGLGRLEGGLRLRSAGRGRQTELTISPWDALLLERFHKKTCDESIAMRKRERERDARI